MCIFFVDGRDGQGGLQLHVTLIRSSGSSLLANAVPDTLNLILSLFKDVYIVLDSLEEKKPLGLGQADDYLWIFWICTAMYSHTARSSPSEYLGACPEH
jgi:hypothetical protein